MKFIKENFYDSKMTLKIEKQSVGFLICDSSNGY